MLDKTFAFLNVALAASRNCRPLTSIEGELADEAKQEVMALRAMPEVVMLAGSSRFKMAFEQIAENLVLQGCIVLGKHVYKPGDEWPLDEHAKDMIHAVQFRMIDLCNRLHIVNVDGYVGQDTYNLVRYAVRVDRTVSFHEERVRLLTKEGQAVSTHLFLQGTRRRVEFEEAATGG